MGKVIYSFSISLDGYIEGPDGGIEWSAPDEELHRFYNDQARQMGTSLYGRRLWEIMAAYWPTADQNPSAPDYVVDFARIWQAMPKLVFSRTLERVGSNARLVRGDVVEEVAKLKAQPGPDMDLGGPTLAAAVMRAGLIDEYRLLVHPVVLGGGKRFFPSLDRSIDLRLAETRTFGSGVVYLRYQQGGPET